MMVLPEWLSGPMHSPARSVLGLALGLAHLVAVAFSQEEEAQDPAGDDSARIIGPVADGTPPAPGPPGELPEFTIRSTTVVSKGGRRIVLHRVDDPNLPEPPPPPPPPTEEQLEALRQSPEVLKAREDMERDHYWRRPRQAPAGPEGGER